MLVWVISLVAIGLCSYCLLVGLRNIAFGRNLFDRIDERTVHTGRVPRLGGIIFSPVLAFIMLLFTTLSYTALAKQIGWLGSWSISPYWFSTLAGLLIILAFGFKDDMVGMNYATKFVGQLLASLILLTLGDYFLFGDILGLSYISFLGENLSCWVYRALSLLVVLTVINSFNLIDGIDGLSSGISLIAFLSYGLWFFWFGDTTNAVICLAMVPVLLAFMRVNIFATADSRRKMFMGDTGSMSLGFLLSSMALAFSTIQSSHCQIPSLPIVLVISPLLLPLMDLVWVFGGRIYRGKNPFLPDRTHVHHRVMDTGLSQRQTLSVLLCLTSFFILLNFGLRAIDANLLLCLDLSLWVVFNIVLYKLKKK